jgi:16S rRNA (guanine1207-N2)-methyltransferase
MTATALWAAQQGGEVVCWTENAAEAKTLTATFTANEMPVPRCFLQAGFSGLEPGGFDMALLHLPRGREMQEEMLKLVGALLRPKSRVYFVGATKEGVRSAVDQAREIYGRVGVLVHKGGYHAAVAQRPAGDFPMPEVAYERTTVMIGETMTPLISAPGVFAHGRLDGGAAALIEGMEISSGTCVLDLGCGVGVVGLEALRREAQVTFVDVSARAVASTRRTLAENGYPDAPIYLSVGTSAVVDQMFDTVITNPPFHQGHDVDFEVAEFFVQDAARRLRAGGQLFLVINAFLKYDHWLQQTFSKQKIVWESPYYRVWKALK